MQILQPSNGTRRRPQTILRGREFTGKLAAIADPETATYFRISGIKNSVPVKNRADAEKAFGKLVGDEEISLIMVTDPVFEWIQSLAARRKKDYPLVVSIPARGEKKPRQDLLAELIKRTVGVELKV
jgi:vacuolar-type H+-ATPase subunit F/Vma7